MPWFDAGVNLTDPRFDAHEEIVCALSEGVTRMCVITTKPSEWSKAIGLYQAYPQQVCFTLGIHPHYAATVTDDDLLRLRELVHQPGMVAIGECGLDFNRNFSPKADQIRVFNAQLALACESGKPVYLHQRDAFSEQVACLEPYLGAISGGIAHCFTQGKAELETYLSMGLYIGVTGWVCDEKRGQTLAGALPYLPMDKLVLETDAPYLFPKTVRPRKRDNRPAYLPHIAKHVAQLMQCDIKEIEQASFRNSCQLFDIADEDLCI